jgi:hypothetical protein
VPDIVTTNIRVMQKINFHLDIIIVSWQYLSMSGVSDVPILKLISNRAVTEKKTKRLIWQMQKNLPPGR